MQTKVQFIRNVSFFTRVQNFIYFHPDSCANLAIQRKLEEHEMLGDARRFTLWEGKAQKYDSCVSVPPV